MKADKQAKIDRRNQKRGVAKPVHKTYTDIVDRYQNKYNKCIF